MRISIGDIARIVGAASGIAGEASGYSIDSRTVEPGDLFIALRGENVDGHEFVADALRKGAVAALVDRAVADRKVLLVDDALAALQQLARWARTKWGGTVIGVTGSAGKTTTKDVIAGLLGSKMSVGKTAGNLNNHIGLPLSILRLPEETRVAVLEFGMNHAGEIRQLAEIGKPDVAVVTNAGYAHIENFESVEGVALAKRELVEALPEGGIAVLNADDSRVKAFGSVHRGRTILFGFSEEAEVRAEDVKLRETGVSFRVGSAVFESSLPGRHGVRNILAGIAVAQVLGIKAEELQDEVRKLVPGKMRGERITHKGITIFNDCYNSNPDAARSMIEVLRDTPARRRIAVLGEMLELGRWSEPLHRDVGNFVVECGISVLVGIRGAARYMVDAAIEAGRTGKAAYFFQDPEEAGEFLRGFAQEGDAILFKGSRGTRVERALEKFLE